MYYPMRCGVLEFITFLYTGDSVSPVVEGGTSAVDVTRNVPELHD